MDFQEVSGTDTAENPSVDDLPVGSQFGHAGERLRSARGQRARSARVNSSAAMSEVRMNRRGKSFSKRNIFKVGMTQPRILLGKVDEM